MLADKVAKHLHKNMWHYGTSANADISAQYNAARTLVATVLRATEQMRHDGEASLQALKQLKADIDQHDIVDKGALDSLIRQIAVRRSQSRLCPPNSLLFSARWTWYPGNL